MITNKLWFANHISLETIYKLKSEAIHDPFEEIKIFQRPPSDLVDF